MEQNKGFWYADWSFPIFVGLLSAGVFAGTHMYYLYGIGAFNEVAFVAMLKAGIDTGAYGADVMMGAGNASGRFLGPLIILSAMTASIPIGIGSLVGALLFYIWQKPITGGAILGAMLLGSIFPVAIS